MTLSADWPSASSGSWLERPNPADTSEIVSRAPMMNAQDVIGVVDRATQAARAWRRSSIHARGQTLVGAAQFLRSHAEEIARDITRENGKTLAESRVEVGFAASCFDYYGNLSRYPLGEVLADRRDGATAWTVREPLGVVVLITPWNDPLATPARKLAAALLAGNAVVLKPAREVPLSSRHLTTALVAGGVPLDVIGLVIGASSEVSEPLLRNPQIQAVSFTGSTPVGLDLSRQLAGTTTRLQTEMGGKNATYVHNDADLALAVDTILGSMCGQAGQRCTATSRVIAHESVHQDVLDRLRAAASSVAVGPGLHDGIQMGPLVSEPHLDGVLGAVRAARTAGAGVVAGGDRILAGGLDRGHFFAPTVLMDVDPSMAVWREEVFAPLVTVTKARSLEDAIVLVNDSTYGLAAGVFTSDLETAHRFVEEVDTGQVAVNLPTGGWDIHMPFGGFKDSGSPFKENGTEGMRFYTRLKTVAVKYR